MVEEAYYNCLRCKNRKVQILTVDGKKYRGTVVDVDRQNVYLRPDKDTANTSAFYPWGFGAGGDILTLSLFTLLAIALI